MPVLRSRSRVSLHQNINNSRSIYPKKQKKPDKNTAVSQSTTVEATSTRAAISSSDRVLRSPCRNEKKTATVLPPVIPVPSRLRSKAQTSGGTATCNSDRHEKPHSKKKSTTALSGKIPNKPVDPYAVYQLSDSGDEKENIDPNLSAQGQMKKKETDRKQTTHPTRTSFIHRPRPTPANNTIASPQPLTGRSAFVAHHPAAHRYTQTSEFIRRNSLSTTSTPQVPAKSSAEEERRRNAAATIYLPAPSAGTPPVEIGRHRAPLASTPAGSSVISSTAILQVVVPPHITPVGASSALTAESVRTGVAVCSTQPSTSKTQAFRVDSTVSNDKPVGYAPPAAMEEHNTGENESIPSGEVRTSAGSAATSNSSGRRRRRLSEREHQEAYSSWLDDFNAQLEQFESHELTIDEGDSR